MNVEQTLRDLGWALPAPPKPIAAYVPSVRSGNLLFVSGQLPTRDGKLLATGAVPTEVAIEKAQEAAGQCAVNALAILGGDLGGDWNRLVRVVRVGAFVLSSSGFADQAKVANGASELLQKVFADAGRHARAAVGVSALPLNASVEVEFLFEIR